MNTPKTKGATPQGVYAPKVKGVTGKKGAKSAYAYPAAKKTKKSYAYYYGGKGKKKRF